MFSSSQQEGNYALSVPPLLLASSSAGVHPSSPLLELQEKGLKRAPKDHKAYWMFWTPMEECPCWVTYSGGREAIHMLNVSSIRVRADAVIWRTMCWEVGAKLLDPCDITVTVGEKEHKKGGQKGNGGVVGLEV